MSVQVKQEGRKLDPRFARRLALLNEGRKFDSLPSSWTLERSIEASKASREMPVSDINEYNGTFELA